MPRARLPHPPDFRVEAVRLVRTSGKTLKEIAAYLGVSTEPLREWVRQADIDAGRRQGLTTAEGEALQRLRREVRLLREDREILKSRGLVGSGDRPDAVAGFRFVEQQKAGHAVAMRCRVRNVSSSGYDAWRSRPVSAPPACRGAHRRTSRWHHPPGPPPTGLDAAGLCLGHSGPPLGG